ncbi:MAG: hypothetical protein PHR26_00745 [Candidatus ainarchaeum sp.]|nr:hypothetical protein [Candidatus ainarchaeum sp.]MDD3976238.1 hypothetical protein [Candidatus ainarchaeum sp.]
MKYIKKSISPLIATVLIIVVAIVLVGLLLSWSQNFVQKSTSDADNAIDTSCIGASITFLGCDYNSVGEKISFTFVNSGDISFNEDHNFNVILIDSDDSFDNSNVNILDSNSLSKGESANALIESYNGQTPINLQLRNTQCTGYVWEITCR